MLSVGAVSTLSAGEASSADTDFFETRIRPLLAENCFNCHSAETNSKGGLRVDDLKGLLQGGQSGPALVPGKPEESLLITAVSHENEELKMPPGKRLSPEELADLRMWVSQGAPWPAVRLPEGFGELDSDQEEHKAKHWAWQPLVASPPPPIHQEEWAFDDVDRYLLARWEEKGWSPVGDVEASRLIRRLYFDLTGLPPTPSQLKEFVADASPERFAETVDRLLASSAFGEKWGRHWLDVARYAESTGPSRNIPYPHAWRYRDYVIKSFNDDKPFDEFLRQQIAGDLLPAASEEEKTEFIVATGFLALGVKDVNQRFRVRFVMDNVDEQIDTLSRAVLGLTVSCARCHDHKFDPITAREYYGLAGIFTSTELCAGVRNKMGGGGLDYYAPESLLVLGPDAQSREPDPARVEALRKDILAARKEFQSLKGKPEGNETNEEGVLKRVAARQKWNKLQQELVALTDPASRGIAVMGVREGATPADTEVRVRGEAEKLGPTSARGFLDVLNYAAPRPVNTAQSGRLELADWLASPTNPLPARVMVNRVWRHLFGEGIVRTVDNFGVTGDRPSHPELLDHLAKSFIDDGWSLKRLIRRLVLTHAYRLDSKRSEVPWVSDPDNRLYWYHPPRRLTAEELRDGILFTSGSLRLEPGVRSAAAELKVVEIRNNGQEAKRIAQVGFESRCRSVYLPLLRDLVPISLTAFDFADQSFVIGKRDDTNVPSQSLYFLNSKLILRESLALAESLLREELSDAARIDRLYESVLGRKPSASEVADVNAYLHQQQAELTASADRVESAVTLAEPPTAATVALLSTEPSKDATTVSQSPTSPTTESAKKKIDNPDDPDVTDQLFEEPFTFPSDPRVWAWMSLCQSLYGSAEFRYVW
jgi:mono/diheme cytochrome c family protein